MESGDNFVGVSSPPPWGSQGFNSGYEAWWQMPCMLSHLDGPIVFYSYCPFSFMKACIQLFQWLNELSVKSWFIFPPTTTVKFILSTWEHPICTSSCDFLSWTKHGLSMELLQGFLRHIRGHTKATMLSPGHCRGKLDSIVLSILIWASLAHQGRSVHGNSQRASTGRLGGTLLWMVQPSPSKTADFCGLAICWKGWKRTWQSFAAWLWSWLGPL